MCYYYFAIKFCRSGETGRRTGLKIQRWQHRAGSTPAFGTKSGILYEVYYFFVLNIGVRFLGGPLRVVLSDPDRNKLLPRYAKNSPLDYFFYAVSPNSAPVENCTSVSLYFFISGIVLVLQLKYDIINA